MDKFFYYLRRRQAIKYIPANSIIIDIGCGKDGRFLKSISSLTQYGIGIDENACAEKSSKLEIKKIHLIDTIPFAAASADIITMLAALEHFENPQKILNECFRILKNNGKLIFTIPAPSSKPVLEFLAFKLNLIDKRQIEDHKNYFSAFSISAMLLKAGFVEKNIKNRYFEFGFNSLFVAKKTSV